MPATHLALLLDQSGSMEPIKADTIGSYNQYLAEQRSAALPGDTWTLTLFNTDVHVRHAAIPVHGVPNLTPETYRPAGNTALLDAIVATVGATEARVGAAGRVLFVILTDGEENSSTHATRAEVTALLDRKQVEGNWTCVYLGANVEAFAEAGALGIHARNALQYVASGSGVAAAAASLAASTSAYRRMAARSSRSFFVPPQDAQP